jgi:flavodoxin
MKALVVYESMFGNTRHIAEAIAEGLRSHAETAVATVEGADAAIAAGVDLLVVGGPTHLHGMSRPSTRKGAVRTAEKPGSELTIERGAQGSGLREWFSTVDRFPPHAAAFDTRLDGPAAFTGRASKRIARELKQHGAILVGDPQSFLVNSHDQLEPDQPDRAREWGSQLGRAFDAAAT